MIYKTSWRERAEFDKEEFYEVFKIGKPSAPKKVREKPKFDHDEYVELFYGSPNPYIKK